ncbi:MAG: hypothetical protein ACOC22_01240 [bacterium]
MSETKTIKPIEFNLPINHETELLKAEQNIKNFRREVNILKLHNSIDDETHTQLYNEIVNTLDWVGRMSVTVFDVRDDLERLYEAVYCKAPSMGFKLFDEHYSRLHHPYSTLKNRCFTLLDDLDQLYINKFKKNPPNWEI